jgi:hypothetical protein
VSIRWSAGWADQVSSGAYKGVLTRGTVNGATSTVTLVGRQLALVAEVGPKSGWIDITVNGTYDRRISLWNSTRVPARVLWLREYPTSTSMKIQLKAVTTSTRNTVNLDAFLLGR